MNFGDFSTQPNGFPLEADATLGFMQNDYQSAINGLAGLAGGNLVIVSGMIDAGASVSDGWVIVNGELMRFEGGAKAANVVVTQSIVQKQNDGGNLVDRYFTKVLKFGSGSGAIPYSSLVRIETVQGLTSKLINFFSYENEVIVSGCLVSGVTGLNVDISAGVMLINGKFLNMSAYSGGFPIYANEFGQWVNTQPASNYIKFDPYTSQYQKDVVIRATTKVGKIEMMAILPTDVDNTGLGKWSMKGFALCNGSNDTIDMRSRRGVGYDDRLTIPGGSDAFIWDVKYNTPGEKGGSNYHNVSENDLNVQFITIKEGLGANNDQIWQFFDDGNADPIDHRDPFRVLVYIQRI